MKYEKRVTFPAQQMTIFPLSQKSCNGSLQMLKNPGKKHFYNTYQLIHNKHCQSEVNSNFLYVLHSEVGLKFIQHNLEKSVSVKLLLNYILNINITFISICFIL